MESQQVTVGDGFESSVAIIDEVTREIKVTIPVDRVDTEVGTALAKLTREAKIKGFRPGKAPRALVEKMYGANVRLDIAQRLIDSSLKEIVRGQSLRVVGDPEIEISSIEEGKPMAYSAKLALFPEPAIRGYDKIRVKVTQRTVEDKDVDTVIEKLRDSKGTLKRIELRQTATKGDVVDVGVAIAENGAAAGRPEPVVFALGEKELPVQVEEAIVGMELGATKTIEVPADVQKDGALPKVYTVTLNALYERVLPELNDDFVKTLELNVATVLELRLKIRASLEEEVEKQKKNEIHAEIVSTLVQQHEFMIPQVLIDDEIRSLLLRSNVTDAKSLENIDLEPLRANFGEAASKRVKGTIILDRIAEAEKITLEPAEFEKEIAAIAEQSGIEVKELMRMLADRGRSVGMIMELTRQKVLDFLTARTEVEVVSAEESDKTEKAK